MATVSVRGRGRVAAQPDEVEVGLTVEALRDSAAEASSSASELAQAVIDLCEELGVPAASRTTSRVSLAEHGEHTNDGWRHRGYRGTARLAVRLTDASEASRLLTEAAARLQVRLDGPTWRIDDANPGPAEARRLAAVDARAKASEYAEALGARLGPLVSVAEPGTGASTRDDGVVTRYAAAAMPIEAGEHEIVAELDVTFQLEHE